MSENEIKTSTETESISYDSLNKTELKNLCKEKNLPVSGTKQELIDRLLNGKSNPKTTKSTKTTKTTDSKESTKDNIDSKGTKVVKKVKQTITKTNLEKPVFKNIMDKDKIVPIVIKRNIHNNFEHLETRLVFSEQKKVIGVQDISGEIRRLNVEDLENVYKYHFELCKEAKVQDNISNSILKDDSEKEKRIQDLINMTNTDLQNTESESDDEEQRINV